MRVLHVLSSFSPKMGGVATAVFHLAKHLSARGHRVTVAASDFGNRQASFPKSGFEVILFPSVASQYGLHLTPSMVGWARHRVVDFDIIHLHDTRTFQNVVVRQVAVREGVPYVLSAHGTLPIIVERKLAKHAYDLVFGRRLLNGASRLVAVSDVEVDQYIHVGIPREHITLVYNGLDLDEFALLPPRGSLRQKLGIPRENAVVLFLGRLHRRKGIDHLVKAFAWLGEEVKDAILVIAGPDEGELAQLQSLVGRLQLGAGVRFAGPLYGQEKLAAYVDADVLASPAIHEIFGLVPFEALMCGTPVVVADDSGCGRLVSEIQAGRVVPYGDVGALAEALLDLITDHEKSQRMVKAGQAYVCDRLDWEIIVEELEYLYTEVVGGGRAA